MSGSFTGLASTTDFFVVSFWSEAKCRHGMSIVALSPNAVRRYERFPVDYVITPNSVTRFNPITFRVQVTSFATSSSNSKDLTIITMVIRLVCENLPATSRIKEW